MATIADACRVLEEIAPLALAEPWDNVGLLLGDRNDPLTQLLTCLTLSPNVVDEAIALGASLVVTHHPIPFRPLAKLTTDTIPGGILWRLASHRIAVYSPHTAYDSAPQGINQQLALRLGLQAIEPLVPIDGARRDGAPVPGSGRLGRLPKPISMTEWTRVVRSHFPDAPLQSGRPRQTPLQTIAIACGSGGSFLDAADRRGADCLITGETNLHTALDAKARGIGLILLGHHASERFAIETLATMLAPRLPETTVTASTTEVDPIDVIG
jgi:dinuclear metal center YbgI/SA1388 family protein